MSKPTDASSDALARALDFLAVGEWEPAHKIVQE